MSEAVMNFDLNEKMPQLVEIAVAAGNAILEVYNRDEIAVEKKGDNSPITEADLAAHHIIMKGLAELTPNIPVHSEESEGITWEMRRDWKTYWLVDPLDGTKEFIKRNGEFTVNIALMDQGRPVAGVVHVPVTSVTYFGGEGFGAFRREAGVAEKISARVPVEPIVMVASRSHGTDKLAALESEIETQMGVVELANMGSSLKLCLVAEGKADIYPRLAPTSEWDTAAAHALVTAAGGVVLTTELEPLRYNKEDILNPYFVVLGAEPQRWDFLKEALASL
jgi:3'(2'), 5'-bisphosphate nucleotidase